MFVAFDGSADDDCRFVVDVVGVVQLGATDTATGWGGTAAAIEDEVVPEVEDTLFPVFDVVCVVAIPSAPYIFPAFFASPEKSSLEHLYADCKEVDHSFKPISSEFVITTLPPSLVLSIMHCSLFI